jgi:hypothetical protein
MPEPPPHESDVDLKFRATGLSTICWLVAAFAHACAVAGLSAGNTPAFRFGFFIGSFIGLRLFAEVLAIITRRAFGQSNKTANIVFSVGVLAWAVLGALNVNNRGPRVASAAEASVAGTSIAGGVPRMSINPSRSSPTVDTRSAPSARRAAVAPWGDFDAPVTLTPQQKARAARGVFLARQSSREQAAAARLVSMIEDGRPWAWVDGVADAQDTSPAFRQAYATWREAERGAGNDTGLPPEELAAINKLLEIRKALAQYRARNDNHPPALAVISGLPPNPLTGSKTVAAAGAATERDGWSYDESSGTMRIVLPPTTRAGLSTGEFEWPRSAK